MSSASSRWIGRLCSRPANFATARSPATMANEGTQLTENVSTWSAPKNRIASGLVSSRTLPSSFIARPACSSWFGSSSGGLVNMYGVWHVPTAATISPIDLLLNVGPVLWTGLVWHVPRTCPTRQLPVHRFVDLIQQRHRPGAAGGARFRLAALTNGRDKFHILPIEGQRRVERDILAFAVGHRVPVDLVGVFLTDISVKPAKGALVIEGHGHREEWPL